MVRDAEAHADEDRRRKAEAEVRNNADSLVYQTEKVLREHGDKVTGSEKEAVESALGELKEAIAGGSGEADVERIRTATDTLMGASQTFSQRLYESAAAESGATGDAGGAGGGTPSDDDVVDAEIVDDEEDRSA
jgi:molecular chaperone DnaK